MDAPFSLLQEVHRVLVTLPVWSLTPAFQGNAARPTVPTQPPLNHVVFHSDVYSVLTRVSATGQVGGGCEPSANFK